MTSITFSEYGERSKMMQLVEGDCPKTKVEELPHITKVHCSVDSIKKLAPILDILMRIFLRRSMKELLI
jgi:hypothetical protein